MGALESEIKRRLAAIRDRIADACAKAGRDPREVKLIAVTKYAAPACVRALVELGERDLGESRPQQLVERAGWFTAEEGVRWHLVGHLQRNKARRVLPLAALIHSVDSTRLASTLDRLAEEEGGTPRVLLEVNMTGEAAKHGFSPQELRKHWNDLANLRRVRIDGLMTMAARTDDPEETRATFRGLRQLRDELGTNAQLPELSMGMSGDFEIAVEEGATMVRIGSRLFDGLDEVE